MSNLIQITKITFYFGDSNFEEQFQCKEFLDSNNIPYQRSLIFSKNDITKFFETMNISVFGADFNQYTFTEFPIITWIEQYDDYERFMEVARNVTELTNSKLLLNKSLIQI